MEWMGVFAIAGSCLVLVGCIGGTGCRTVPHPTCVGFRMTSLAN